MTDEHWSPVFRCPQCGYETTVTNVCRRCRDSVDQAGIMYATELEEDWEHKRRTLRTQSCIDEARTWNGICMGGYSREGKEIPVWAYGKKEFLELLAKAEDGTL